MQITVEQVKNIDDITVQTLESDGELRDCNHAGAYEDTITRYSGHDTEYEEYAVVCDKANCDAWYDRDGGLN